MLFRLKSSVSLRGRCNRAAVELFLVYVYTYTLSRYLLREISAQARLSVFFFSEDGNTTSRLCGTSHLTICSVSNGMFRTTSCFKRDVACKHCYQMGCLDVSRQLTWGAYLVKWSNGMFHSAQNVKRGVLKIMLCQGSHKPP